MVGPIFVEGNGRGEPMLWRALAMLLKSLGKASLGYLGKLHGVSQTTAYYLVRWEAERWSHPAIPQDIEEIKFDEMSQFLQPKPTTGGLSCP